MTKNLLISSILACCTNSLHAQSSPLTFDFAAKSIGNYRQGPNGTFFEGGTFNMSARDGNFLYDGCNGPRFYSPSPPCPLGATGFVSRGLDGDPLLRGLGPYFSVTELSASVLLAPFDSKSAILVSAPPSLLPRPLGGFVDQSLSVFYNLQTVFIKQYPIAFYDFSRSYTSDERKRFDGEVVPGTYRYNFAALPDTQRPLYVKPPIVININEFPKLDGYRKINSQPQGVRFKNVTYDDGFALLNPFDLNIISWEGNTVSFISPSVDTLFFSIKQLTDTTDPLSDPDPGPPLFPNFVAVGQTRVILPNALETTFTLAPNFLNPGETGLIDLEFTTFRPTTSVIYENATRRFRLPVKVINPFLSFIAASLPPGTTALQMAADYDFDGDGISNFTEWVFGSNPSNANSVPSSPGVNTVSVAAPAGITTFDTIPEVGSALQYKVPKLRNAVPALKYTIEYSKDLATWQTIKADNTSWIISETDKEIKVTGSSTNTDTGGYFRTKVVPLN